MINNSIFRCDVSVVVPMYKAGLALIEALESIRQQTLKPTVVHIVDDQSSSSDASLARAYIADNNIQDWHIHILTENLGAGGARDFGIRRCTTKYIALLDADDIWLPDHLENAFEIIDSYELALFGAQIHKISQGNFCPTADVEGGITKISLNRLLLKCSFLTSTVIFQRASYIRAGGFLPGLRLSEDYSLWLRIVANQKNSCAVTSRVHALYRDSDTETTVRLSNNHWAHERAELNNFAYLYEQGLINSMQLFLSSGLSLLKYLRRLLRGFLFPALNLWS
jgi:glycosyltransferase involved in cell wall biosynthesis